MTSRRLRSAPKGSPTKKSTKRQSAFKRPTKRQSALVISLLAAALFAAACGGSDSTEPRSSSTEAAADAEETDEPDEGAATSSRDEVSLDEVCPANVVVQTDWFPEAEHGGLYEVVGDDPEIDSDAKIVRGPLVVDDAETGVEIEIRTGGPAIGNQKVVAQMKQDPEILLGYVSTAEAIENYADIPTTAVVAPLEINPQIIMWDPETYSEVETIEDLKDEGATILYFQAASYMQYLESEGIVDAEQLDGSYDGSPAVFVAEGGKIAQQGFASAEPFIYENETSEWGKPLDFQLVHDVGWTSYAQPLAILDENFEANEDCLAALVPIMQQAQVDYISDPDETNDLIVKVIEEFDSFWKYTPRVAEFSVDQQLDLGLVGNGDDETLGNFDSKRLEEFLPKAAEVFNADVPAVEELVTNKFIDLGIGL